MPEGSLTQNLRSLQTVMSTAIDLLGVEQADDTPATGYAGAAGLLAQSPQALFDELENKISANFSTLLSSELIDTFSTVNNLYPALKAGTELVPTGNLQQLGNSFSEAKDIFSGDAISGIQNIITTIRQISDNIPEDRSGVISVLTEQIVSLLNQFGGKEAEDITAWIASIQSLYAEITPLIETVADSADAENIVVEIYQRALDRILTLFGFEKVQTLVNFTQEFPPVAGLQKALEPVANAVTTVSGFYSTSMAQTNTDYATFRTSIVSITRGLRDLNRHIRPVLSNIRAVTTNPLFQPNALERYLREQLNKALRVNISEVQKIDDPFNALFDKLAG